jgi:hypothetical protein
MGLWLTEKIDEKTVLALRIESAPHSEATPYHLTRYSNKEIFRSAFSPSDSMTEWSK